VQSQTGKTKEKRGGLKPVRADWLMPQRRVETYALLSILMHASLYNIIKIPSMYMLLILFWRFVFSFDAETV
jgi:hypothetical protein